MSGYTTTPNLGLRKPTVGGDDDLWGGDLNFNSDTLDAQTATKGYTDARRRRFLNAVTTSIPNVGASTSEEVAIIWTLPAGLLAAVGDVIHSVVKAELAGTTDSKTVRMRLTATSNGLGGNVISTMTCNAVATLHAVTESWVMKTAANAQKTWFTAMNANNNVVSGDASPALTDSAVMYLSITVQNNTAATPGSITIFAAFTEYLPGV